MAKPCPPRKGKATCSARTPCSWTTFATDVRPLLAQIRSDAGLDPDPVAAYDRSGYHEAICAERADGAAAGWGA